MIQLNIEVKGINKIRSAYQKRPAVVRKHINEAIAKSIFKIENEATDSNFQFRTPRSKRTGYLQRSFKFGIELKDFYGRIGPTAEYAPKVHGRNPFMERISRISQPTIKRYFEEAVGSITKDIVE